MAKHYYIYLGRERGKRVVHKVGQTIQTCYARCKNADYLIGVGIEISFPMKQKFSNHHKELLNATEKMIINYFASMFPIEHGHEYFRCKGYNWERIKPLFLERMIQYLEEQGYNYTIHEGWVEPNTY